MDGWAVIKDFHRALGVNASIPQVLSTSYRALQRRCRGPYRGHAPILSLNLQRKQSDNGCTLCLKILADKREIQQRSYYDTAIELKQ